MRWQAEKSPAAAAGALGDAGGPGRVGADGDVNLPPWARGGFHERWAGGGDSAARVLLGTVTASGTAWPWPVSHAPWWLARPARLARDPAGSSVSPASLWSPALLSPASLWSWGWRCATGLSRLQGDTGHGGDPALSIAENGGPGRGPHSLLVHMGATLRLACLEIRGCSRHPMAGASIPRGQQHPLGTAAPLGDTEHPRRAWLSAPAGARVAPKCTQPFGGPPPNGCPQIAGSPQALEGPWGSWHISRQGGTGPLVLRRAGENGAGCRRRMLLTQDLPKWFLFLHRGR